MEKITVEVIEPEDTKPQAGDVVQDIRYPDCIYFVSGRGDRYGNRKETCFTVNGNVIKGEYGTDDGWEHDKYFKIIRRNNQTFQYPETPRYTTEIDGVKYKLIPDEECE